MKTHILQLDAYDDLISARDKMSWAKGERILLVWPDRRQSQGRRPALQRRLDLLLLHRRSLALGAQLAIVSQDRDVRAQAHELKIPVFKSLKQAQSAHWRVPRHAPAQATATRNPTAALDSSALRSARPAPEPEAAWRSRYRLVIFSLGVLAVLTIAALLLPAARIQLTPQTQTQVVSISLLPDPTLSSPTLAGAVPARRRTVIVEGRDAEPTQGRIALPDKPANGQITLTNLTDRAVTIPAGLVVRTLGDAPLRFAVQRAAQMPAGAGQSLTLPIEALTPGSRGNLPAGSLSALEGVLGVQLAADNPQPTRGGSDRREPAPTNEDRRRLHERLSQSLRQTALQELESALTDGDVLLPDSLSLVETLQAAYQPPLMEDQSVLPADRLSLHLRLEFQALVIAGDDLQRLAQTVFDANLPPDYQANPTSLHWELDASDPQALKLNATRQISAISADQQAIQLALGQAPDEAARRLSDALLLDEAPRISLTPAWWPRLPILPFRIQVSYATISR